MKTTLGILGSALSTWTIYYIALPALNVNSVGFWTFLLVSLFVSILFFGATDIKIGETKFANILSIIFGFSLILFLITSFFSGPWTNSKTYSSLITLENGDFQEDIEEISFTQIPKIDRDTSRRLGDRKMGEMVELVSQFNVASDYTQINYKEKPVRVSPLRYNGFLKWFNNKTDGIPGYVEVDMVDGQAKLIQLEEKIKYSKSDKFGRNIDRYLQFNYKTAIFGEITFEIDDNGTPYYIASILNTNAGLFGALDVDSVVIVNAINGDIKKYSLADVPNWVDRVYDANIVVKQLNWNGSLHSGYFNSKFAERGVIYTTKGYNYLAIDDDVYLYTGLTSSGKDESNIGFVLVNLRTKETTFYKVPSAEEYSAMETAEGAVQEKEYTSTFPLLLNIEGKPTYFVSLKDNAGLMKMYGFIDAENYQKVSVADTIEKALAIHKGISVQVNSHENVNSNEDTNNVNLDELQFLAGELSKISQVVIDGNTHYYLKINEEIFLANIKITSELAFLEINDKVEIEFITGHKDNIVYKLSIVD